MIHPFNKCFEKVLVLTTNHKISEKRRERMISRLNGIDYSFFYGVDYNELDMKNIYYYNSYDDNNTYLTPGQIGCSLSFNKIYEYIIDNDIQNCMIMEDDVIINKNFNQLEEIYKQLPSDWQLFYLGYGHTDPTPHPNYSSNLYKIDRSCGYQPHGNVGFAIGKEYAKIMLNVNSNIRWAADQNLQNVLRTTDYVAYASVPKVIDHDGMDSVVSEGS